MSWTTRFITSSMLTTCLSSFCPVTVRLSCFTMFMRRRPRGCIFSSAAIMSMRLSTAKVHLGRAEAAHGSVEDIVGGHRVHVGVHVVYGIGAEALGGGAPGYPGAHRQVGARVGVHRRLHRHDAAFARHAYLVVQLVGMALVAFAEGPGAVVGHFYRPAGKPGAERGAAQTQAAVSSLPPKPPPTAMVYTSILDRGSPRRAAESAAC
jgi:hypothetical protein